MIETNEKIRILLKRKNMTVTELAEKVDTTRQNMTNKLNRNNFAEKDLKEISDALGCDLILEFRDRETGEIL